MQNTLFFYFSPGLMPSTTLENLFVQREPLAKRIMDLMLDSVATCSKHHTLLIGSRGLGKTHFVSLIYHRLKSLPIIQQRSMIAWLREDEWGINSLLDLLLRILNTLVPEEKTNTISKEINALYELVPKDAEFAAKRLLEELVQERTLIVLIENLDEIFKNLGENEQKKLRAYLQNKPYWTILATSQGLFDDISLQTFPFYGFFRIYHLKPLELEDAVKLLINIAKFKKDTNLADLISSPLGKARIRAIHHITGGNHRVYAIFSEFLSTKSLDELVNPFMQTLDKLTPYYQSRLLVLSPQQRKIIEYLCEQRFAITVKEIAQRCFLSHQTTSSQLKELRDKGYVVATSVGRESYYELQEPLMRLCLEVKMHQDKPIRLFVDFLRSWYSVEDLEEKFISLSTNVFERDYIAHALEIAKKQPNHLFLASLKDCEKHFNNNELAKALEVIKEIEEAIQHSEKKKPKFSMGILVFKATILLKMNQREAATKAFENSLDYEPKTDLDRFYKTVALFQLERNKETLIAANNFFEVHTSVTSQEFHLIKTITAITLTKLNQPEEALKIFTEFIENNPENLACWFNKASILLRLKRYEEALLHFERVIILLNNSSTGSSYSNINSNDYNFLVDTLYKRVDCLLGLNRWQEGCIALDEALSTYKKLEQSYFIDTATTISILFDSTRDTKLWQTRLQKLVYLFDSHGLLNMLATGLVSNIHLLASSLINNTTIQTWIDIWKNSVENKEQFAVALQLLDVATKFYGSNKDMRSLFQLPIEVRNVLKQELN